MKKFNLNQLSNGMLATIIIVAAIVIDQIIKLWVKTHFFIGEDYEIASWFHLHFIENNGFAFGMELGSKVFLTWFRIIAVGLFIYYLTKLNKRTDVPRGFVVCIALITAGAAGNVIDCIAYGQLFNAPAPPETAQLLPPDGGYAGLFNGRVVDMFYFPLCEWDWPQWMGGGHFIFFQPVFNFADACLSVSVVVLIFFYSKQLTGDKTEKKETVVSENEDVEGQTLNSDNLDNDAQDAAKSDS